MDATRRYVKFNSELFNASTSRANSNMSIPAAFQTDSMWRIEVPKNLQSARIDWAPK